MLNRIFTLGTLAVLATACNAASGTSATASTDSTSSSSSSSSALSTNTNTTALVVGQRVGVTFAADGNTVAQVTIADPNARGMGPMGGGMGNGPVGPPPGNANDANRPAPLDANTLALRGHLHGSVTAVDTTDGKLTVLGVDVLTDVNTQYQGLADLTAVQLGMVVDIDGQSAADGSFTALHIGVRPADLSGVLTAVSSDTPPVLTVLGRTIALSSSTQVVQLVAPAHGDQGPGQGGPGQGGQDQGGRGPGGH